MPAQNEMACFENLAGEPEWFDLDKLRRSDIFGGKWPPHHYTILYAIPSGRWVLGYVDGLDDVDSRPGTLIPFLDIEVAPAFVVRWLADNQHPWPVSLDGATEHPNGDPYQDRRVQRFYRDCESRTREPLAPPLSSVEAEVAPSLVPVPGKPSIRVDVKKCMIYVGEEFFSLSKEAVSVFADALVKANGHLVSFPELKKTHPILDGGNSSRLIEDLRKIPGLKDRVKAQAGKGTRLL